MAAPKTQPTRASAAHYIAALPDARVRTDCRTLMALMERASGARPVLWGTSIIGFGAYRYSYASGTTGDWPLTAFAPRAKDLTVYLMDGFEHRKAELARLGPHTHSKSCLHLKSLDRIDLRLLESMVADSVKAMRARWPAGSDSGSTTAAAATARKPAVKAKATGAKAAAAKRASAQKVAAHKSAAPKAGAARARKPAAAKSAATGGASRR